MAAGPRRRRAEGPVRALVALAVLLAAGAAAAPADPRADAFRAEVAVFARDLASGDARPVSEGDVDFALRVVAPFGVSREAEGLRVRLLRAPREVLVSYEALAVDGSGDRVQRALARYRALFAAVEAGLGAGEDPARVSDMLKTSAGHFGLRPFGVAEGPSVRSRARASSLRWVRSLAAGPADTARRAEALRLWKAAAAARPAGSFYVTGDAMLAAVASETTLRGRDGGKARDARLFGLFAALMEEDPALVPLDPYGADRLAEALEWARDGRLTFNAAPVPAARPAPSKPAFTEVTKGSGLDARPEGDRVSVGGALLDYDGDGWLDLFACVGSAGGRLFKGGPGLRFTDVTEAAGLGGHECRAAAADYDGDGKPDLYLADSAGPNRLMRNVGGRFVDVTKEAGLPLEAMPTQAAVWLDYDGDGLLDLYLVNHGGIMDGNAPYAGDAVNGVRNRLFRQSPAGHFTEVPGAAGADDPRWGRGALAADFDGDGRADLFVFNDFGRARLYRNTGGAFVDDTARAGVAGFTHALGASAGDFDGDGVLDLLVTTYDRRWAPAAALGEERPRSLVDAEGFWMGEEVSSLMRSQLYRGRGDGTFTDVWESTAPAGYTGAAWNGTFVDLDDDGWQDVFLAAGFHPDALFFHSDRKVVWRWDPAARRYLDVSAGSGIDFPDSSRGALFGDLDHDGDLDVVVIGYTGPRVFRNDSPRRHWADVRLVGRRSAREARGALVRVSCGGREQAFPYGSFGGGFMASFAGSLHVGLGDCAGPVGLKVRWPGGAEQEATAALDRETVVTEAAGRP